MLLTKSIAALLIATLAATHGGVKVSGVEYSPEPLTQGPIMSTAEVAVDFTRFNNWVVEQKSLSPERYPPIREHAYLLIDSILKIRNGEARTTFNDFERFTLEQLFNLSTGLGAYGAGLVARELASGSDRKAAEPLLPQEPNVLRLQFPYFVLSSKAESWQLRFPYYFMLWQVSRFTAKNGLLTDMSVLSTSFSKHDKGPGESQATIMFMYSPKADCEVFNRSWLELLAIDPAAKTSKVLLPSSKNYYAYDATTNIHKEVTVLADALGCYALAYSGIGGPYQANRVSYLDFVKSLDRTRGTSNIAFQPSDSAVTPRALHASRHPAGG